MGKNKVNKDSSIEERIAFLTDDAARQKGIRTWKTGGSAGREPVGNLMGIARYLGNTAEQRDKLGLEDGEINPYLMSEVEGQDPSKSMYQYWASDAMPQLPKALRKQYDVVFAGTRPAEPRDHVMSSRYGADPFAPKAEENIWQFVPKVQAQKEPKPAKDPISAIASLPDGDGDRPVTIGTTSYTDPNRAADPSNFLSTYIRSTALPTSRV